jgi:hypothetical protein
MEVNGQLNAPVALPIEKYLRYPLCRYLDGVQNWYERREAEDNFFPWQESKHDSSVLQLLAYWAVLAS